MATRFKMRDCPLCGGTCYHPRQADEEGFSYRAARVECMDCDYVVMDVQQHNKVWERIEGKVIARGYLSDYELPYKSQLTIHANEPESKRPPRKVKLVLDE